MSIEKCPVCDNSFQSRSRKRFCSSLCAKIHRSHLAFPTLDNCVECKECGMRAHQIYRHIKTCHMPIDEYCKKYGLQEKDLISSISHNKMSTGQKSAIENGHAHRWNMENNPSHSSETKSGRNSVWSMNFKGYDGLTDDEKRKRIAQLSKKACITRNARHNNRLRIDYYTSRGFSLKEARKILSKSQANFSLSNCVKKYGEKRGREIWQARQDKWQATLKSKPLEEIERINRSKFKNTGYSEISQKLFNSIYEKIRQEYKDIYFATLGFEPFNEYMVHDPEMGKNYFLDFYVKDVNRAIEFDGYYWHDKLGTQKKDQERETRLKCLGYDILRIKERAYREDPDTILESCLAFIRGK